MVIYKLIEGRGRKLVNLVMDRHEPSSIDTMTYLNNVNIVGVDDQSGNANINEQVESIYSDFQVCETLRITMKIFQSFLITLQSMTQVNTNQKPSNSNLFVILRNLHQLYPHLALILKTRLQLHLPANNNSQPEISELVLPKSIENSANVDGKYLKSDCEDQMTVVMNIGQQNALAKCLHLVQAVPLHRHQAHHQADPLLFTLLYAAPT
ncbi:unnamed protein product [Parnassius apollo]|uniref:(apollo) hypothetical protein n=1 Tax=Parnassius apollo TaxID=110799 RepID=A0A8S3WWW3_PARAO|nr:unnamed protein product [Parnassius apollo]